ncbi:hypothetical protein J6TS2_33320 [Heyndrickxia sporothermodurans]|nr:hypothetical protein J6TS2_33320 [Heyndrickxia sporothermodurans]
MDKHNQKIKIKINGDERPFKEDVEIHDWKSGGDEIAAGAENASDEEHFDWVLPEIEENQVQEFKKINYMKTNSSPSFSKKIKKTNNRHFSMVFLSIITAVTMGVLIGLFMLKVVIYQSNSVQKTNTHENTNVNSSSNKAGKASVVRIPSLTTALVQGGVYKNPEPVVQSIKNNGLPAVVFPLNNQQFIYIGVADEIETAKSLAALYKKQGVDVFAKQLTFEGKSISINTKDEEKFITLTIPLFSSLSQEIAESYISGNSRNESLTSLKNEIDEVKNLKEINSKQLKNLKNSQLDSYQSLVSYQNSHDKQDLLSAQNFLLLYLQEINRLK